MKRCDYMANYSCVIRTNYFHVKDEDRFLSLIESTYSECGDIEVITKYNKLKNPLYGFACCGWIDGVMNPDDEDEETSYDLFLDKLQECVAEDDAIIIFESGHEKLRYLIGSATIITAKEIKYLSIENYAINTVKEMLGNKNWNTTCDY